MGCGKRRVQFEAKDRAERALSDLGGENLFGDGGGILVREVA
jgi:hypothetical protein